MNNYKLIGSSNDFLQLQEAINKYFYSVIHVKQSQGFVWKLYNKKGLMKPFRVSKKGKRYRFERLTDDF